MKFVINQNVFNVYPDCKVAWVEVEGLLAALDQLDVDALYLKAQQALDAFGISCESLSSYPFIAAWRQAYKGMGVKPSKFKSSIEALAKRSLKNGVPQIGIPGVDFYNMCSVKHMAPVGAYDVQKLKNQPVELRLAQPESDVYVPLGGESSSFPLSKDLVVYAQDSDVLCWGFNHRDSKLTCLDEKTDHAVFVSESASAEHHKAMVAVLEEITALLESAGAKVSMVKTT